jgi:beta-glucosidase
MPLASYPGTHPSGKGTLPPCRKVPYVSGDPGPCDPTKAHYSERMLTGYRWYDANAVKPAFAFGHGLSYSAFSFGALLVAGRSVSFTLSNVGGVAAIEVPQLYLRAPQTSGESSYRQLRGFRRCALAAGESVTVNFTLTDRWLSQWDVDTHNWKLIRGVHSLMVGASSDDIRLHASLNVS